jgi:NADH dehydrogenase ubiquinone Fe-S protein 4
MKNVGRAALRLPGSSMPAYRPVPVAHIYQPARSPMQAGLARRNEWVLEFEPWGRSDREALMGWRTSEDPFASIQRLRFPDRESAIAFAEREGWHYVAHDPPARRIHPKSYADNFRYDLAEAILRSQQAQEAGATTAVAPAWPSTAAGHLSDARRAS